MRFNFVDKSQLWSGIAILMFGSGTMLGIGAMATAEKIGEIVSVEKRFREAFSDGCTVKSILSTIEWANEYSDDGYLRPGQKIDNDKHCAELNAKVPQFVEVSETVLVESSDGPIVETAFEYDRDWGRDLGRRFLLLIGGILIGFVAALPWIAVYQVTRRLEEIRDRSK